MLRKQESLVNWYNIPMEPDGIRGNIIKAWKRSRMKGILVIKLVKYWIFSIEPLLSH